MAGGGDHAQSALSKKARRGNTVLVLSLPASSPVAASKMCPVSSDHPHPVSRLLLTQWTPWTLHWGKIQVFICLKHEEGVSNRNRKFAEKNFLIYTKSTVLSSI